MMKIKVVIMFFIFIGHIQCNIDVVGTIEKIFPNACVNINYEGLEQMARLIHSESDGEPFDGKLLVGEVAINIANCRGRDVLSVITDKKIFHGVSSKKYREVPGDDSYAAAIMILNGYESLPNSIVYYYNEKTAKNWEWISKIKNNIYKKIGNHTVCYDLDCALQI